HTSSCNRYLFYLQTKLYITLIFSVFDNFLCYVCRCILIACKFKCEAASALSYLTDICGEVVHFCHWNFSLNNLHTVFTRVHTEHSTPALGYFAHDVAHVVVRNHSFKRTDRLQKCWVCLWHTVFVSYCGSHLKGHFRGVNRMIRTVVKCGFKSISRISCERSFLESVSKSLLLS